MEIIYENMQLMLKMFLIVSIRENHLQQYLFWIVVEHII